MDLFLWILFFIADSIFCYWVVYGEGAEWMEGWKSLFFIDWIFAHRWSSEQIRLYMVLWWLGHAVWFVAGLFIPVLRL